MYIFSDSKNVALIEIEYGKITDIIYKNKRGIDTVTEIKKMGLARYHFKESKTAFDHSHKRELVNIPNLSLFHLFEVQSPERLMHSFTKILVVEDSGLIRKSIVQTLELEKYNIIEAQDGEEALAKINNELPDIVLLDLILPKIDGYEVLSQIKKLRKLRVMPVIVLTSRDTLFDKLKGKMSGTDEYLTKPFEREDLLFKISQYVL